MKQNHKTKDILITLGVMAVVGILVLGGIFSSDVYADENKAVRTIMYYECGSDPETNSGAATANLVEAMNAKFDNKQIRFIVMTGGADQWHMDSEYLRDQDGKPIEKISNEYNQIWELTGATEEGHGHMTLLKGDGVTGNPSARELMNDPTTLTAFINWAKARYPAEHYNLMLWDHGSGPAHGYGLDENKKDEEGNVIKVKMPVADIVRGVSASDVIKERGKFDIIEFDCCMMGNFEITLALQDYTQYYIGCPDIDPFPSLDYTEYLNYLGGNPNVDNKTLGRKTVDIYVDWYNAHPEEESTNKAVALCMVDTQKLKESGIVDDMRTIAEGLKQEAANKRFYDEIRSAKDDFQYAFPTLQSLETLVEQLGINLYELESLDNPTLSNDYTEAAKAIRAILSNEDVIYARSTSLSKEDKTVIGRAGDGNVEIRDPAVPLSALTTFFITNVFHEEYTSYVDGMNDLVTVLTDEKVKNYISAYRDAVIDYKLIFESGKAVSAIVDSGTPASDVNFHQVEAYWQSHDTESGKKIWDPMSKLISSRGGGTEAWLEEIIDLQKNEVIQHDKVDIREQSADGKDYYRLDIKNTPKRLIDTPKISLTAKTVSPPEGAFTDEIYMEYEGEQVFDGLNPEEIDSFLDIIAGKKSSYRVPRFDGEWYAVEDASGAKYIASLESDNTVRAQFKFENDPPDAIPQSGLLVFDQNGKVKSIVIEDKPIDIDSVIGQVTAELMNSSKSPMPFPISIPFDPKNAKLIKAPVSELNISKVDVELSIEDMYLYKHEIKPELRFDPNGGTWEDGGNAVREYEADLETQFEMIKAPKKDGYTFVCWKGSEYQPGQKYLVSEDHLFTAQWRKNDSDAPGGSGGTVEDDPGANDTKKVTGNDSEKSGKGPETGVAFTLLPLLLLLLLAAGGMITVLVQRHRRTGNIGKKS